MTRSPTSHDSHDGRSDPQRPDALVERGLLAYPDAFGAHLSGLLREARTCVLRDGDELSRTRLLAARPESDNPAEIDRIRTILALRPHAAELAAPALILFRDSVVVAIAHPIPAAGSEAACRFHLDSGAQVSSRTAQQIDPSPELLLRWSAIGHDGPPYAVWRCDRPPPCDGARWTGIEIFPDPRSFHEVVLIVHRAAGRMFVPEQPIDAAPHAHAALRAAVMTSGWSYALDDRWMGPGSPHALSPEAPPPPHVRIPDDRLFACCAARTWTASPRDARWLREQLNDRLNHRPTTTTAPSSRRSTP